MFQHQALATAEPGTPPPLFLTPFGLHLIFYATLLSSEAAPLRCVVNATWQPRSYVSGERNLGLQMRGHKRELPPSPGIRKKECAVSSDSRRPERLTALKAVRGSVGCSAVPCCRSAVCRTPSFLQEEVRRSMCAKKETKKGIQRRAKCKKTNAILKMI